MAIHDWSVNNIEVEKEILKRIEQYPVGSQDTSDVLKEKVALHIFGGPIDYYLTEGEKVDNDDIEFFGWCNLGNDQNAEFGYVTLNEIKGLDKLLRSKFIMLEVEAKCPDKTLYDVAISGRSCGLDKFLDRHKDNKSKNKQVTEIEER